MYVYMCMCTCVLCRIESESINNGCLEQVDVQMSFGSSQSIISTSVLDGMHKGFLHCFQLITAIIRGIVVVPVSGE